MAAVSQGTRARCFSRRGSSREARRDERSARRGRAGCPSCGCAEAIRRPDPASRQRHQEWGSDPHVRRAKIRPRSPRPRSPLDGTWLRPSSWWSSTGRAMMRLKPWAGRAMEIREVMKLIERDGWFLVAVRGSHRQYKHPDKPGWVAVAGHPDDDLAAGTLNSVLKQAGLRRPKGR